MDRLMGYSLIWEYPRFTSIRPSVGFHTVLQGERTCAWIRAGATRR